MKKTLLLSVFLFSCGSVAAAPSAEPKSNFITKSQVRDKAKMLAEKKLEAKSSAGKKKSSPEIPSKAEIESGSILYDKEQDVITFEDKVSMSYQGKKLSANKVVYNRAARLITAEEGVELQGATGNNFVAEKMTVDDELKQGTLEKVRATMKDGSVIKSEQLKILDKDKYLLKSSSYSPCKPCSDGTYLWSIASDKILYDEQSGRVTYTDATMKVFDHTVGWTPYISHPTPYAKSKSGLLSPSFGRSSLYGNYLTVPYYWQPYEYMDFTIAPTMMSEDGLMLQLEHRQKFYSGDYLFRTSGIYTDRFDSLGNKLANKGKDYRGHIEGEGKFDLENLIGKYWSFDFKGKRVSDDTYLQRYNLGYEDYLTSVGSIKKIEGRNLFQASAVTFQGLRLNDDPATTPLVFPTIDYRKTYALDTKVKSRLDTIGNALVLRRKSGAQSTRAIAGIDWNGEYLSQNGHMFNFSLLNRVDHFIVDNQPVGGQTFNGNVSRYIPQGSVEWNYPLYNSLLGHGVIIDPVVMGVVSPYGQNDQRIPVEDSQNIEIFDYNLFQPSHISGYDLVENGPRVNYGLRTIINDTWLGDVSTLMGQTYRTKKDKTFSALSGMDDYLSDYVGRLSVEGNKHFNSTYGVRVDKNDSKIRRSEWSIFSSFDPITVNTTYTFVDNSLTAPERQELLGDVRYKIDESWAISARARRNLNNDNNNGWVNAGSSIEWGNECLTTAFGIDREFTRDRDIKPDTRFMFWVNLANLGN
ncbi:MAG TPA: hypothetical protein DIV86_00925 [Alphaproteobacteria bacterium]|nr:hypothetical protein [Alphaproteobacteria bacterium]